MIDINSLSKTEAGRKTILQKIGSSATGINREIDRQCWALYNNEHNAMEYEYLRKYGDYELPAHVRHVPKQRPFIDWLVARHKNLPKTFDTYAVDKESLERKHSMKAAKKAELYYTLYKEKGYAIKAQIQQLVEQQQKLQQELSKLNPNDPQQAEQYAQAEALFGQINQAINKAVESLTEMNILNDETLSRLKMMKKFTDRDIMEHWAQVAARSIRKTCDIDNKGTQSFIHRCVTGKQWFLVDMDVESKKLIFRALLPHSVFFQDVEDVLWTQHLDWAGFEEFMTPADVVSEFGHLLSEDEIKSIETGDYYTMGSSSQGPFVAGPGNVVYDAGRSQGMDYRPVSSGSINMGSGISVKRIWWVADVKPKAIKKPNPYIKGKYFTNIIDYDDPKQIIDEKDYKYNNQEKKYIHRNNESIVLDRSKVRPYNSLKGDYLDVRSKYDRFKGVIIDNQIYLSERDIQVRNIDNPSKNLLPIVGPTFNNISMQPYSYIWATKDLQKLYNLINYHKELTLAVSGTKALLMDIVQKPKAMTDEEWEYHKKMGTIKIQTRREGIGQLQPTFNQFQVIDMSLSASIQYFDMMLDNIETQIGLIMGITRQSMGQVTNVDQVGTFQMSQQSTLLVTQMLFDNHNEVERQAMNIALMLAKDYLFDEDTVVQIFNDTIGEELVRIPGKSLRKADFEIIMQNSAKQDASRAELMQFAFQNYKAGMLPYSNFISMYNTESLKELEIMSKYFDEEARRLQMESKQMESDQNMALEDKKGKLAMQMAQYSEKLKQETEQIKQQFETAKTESENKFKQAELELKMKELELKNKQLDQDRLSKLLELTNRKNTEDNNLLENQRATNINAQIQLIEAEIKRMQLGLQKDTDDKSLKIEEKKANKQSSL